MPGLLGGLFDLNHDGRMNAFERATELMFLDEMTSDKTSNYVDYDIDPEELELMDDDERREALEDAGLDPDDYDMY